jgi:hypothetical protein
MGRTTKKIGEHLFPKKKKWQTLQKDRLAPCPSRSSIEGRLAEREERGRRSGRNYGNLGGRTLVVDWRREGEQNFSGQGDKMYLGEQGKRSGLQQRQGNKRKDPDQLSLTPID